MRPYSQHDFAAFVEDRCVKKGYAPTDELYAEYLDWVRSEGKPGPVTYETFNNWLTPCCGIAS